MQIYRITDSLPAFDQPDRVVISLAFKKRLVKRWGRHQRMFSCSPPLLPILSKATRVLSQQKRRFARQNPYDINPIAPSLLSFDDFSILTPRGESTKRTVHLAFSQLRKRAHVLPLDCENRDIFLRSLAAGAGLKTLLLNEGDRSMLAIGRLGLRQTTGLEQTRTPFAWVIGIPAGAPNFARWHPIGAALG